MRRLLIAAAALSVAGCSTPSEAEEAPRPFIVVGSVTVQDKPWTDSEDYQNPRLGDPCDNRKGYTDIKGGTQVVISDESGTTVALGELSPGELTYGDVIDEGKWGTSARACTFTFRVEQVPDGLSFYGVEVADRGRLQFARDDIRHVQLSIG